MTRRENQCHLEGHRKSMTIGGYEEDMRECVSFSFFPVCFDDVSGLSSSTCSTTSLIYIDCVYYLLPYIKSQEEFILQKLSPD